MATIADIMGRIYKMDDDTHNIYIHKEEHLEKNSHVLPYVKLKSHYKHIEAQVRANEAKAYASGYNVYDFNTNKDKGSFEIMNTSHGIDFIFVPKKKTA